MIECTSTGAYLARGQWVPADGHAPEALAALGFDAAAAAQAKKGTIAWGILQAHNTSGDEENLKIKFDAMASHDITFVGIIQTARASGLEKFPLPYVLTNCHNSLCAVGGTINEDDHRFGLSAAKKYGGIFVPPHLAVIHQYMREKFAGCGRMILGSDSHTRYGALGTMAIGEGGGELAKQLLGRTYDVACPGVVAVYLTGALPAGCGPHDVAIALVGALFKSGYVKNKVMEFIGPGVASLRQDTRNAIDAMTTETTCLSSIWETDETTRKYLAAHGRAGDYKPLAPANLAYYDGVVKVDLSAIRPMIALPMHPSNAYTIEELNANLEDILHACEQDVQKLVGRTDVKLDLCSKIENGRLRVDQGVIAGCAGGLYDSIVEAASILKGHTGGCGEYALSVYPASQPVMMALDKAGALSSLMASGATIRTAFCGPCFGAGDVPFNGALSIRHTTRNFPSREGSKPGAGQLAGVALMDARSIAATTANGGILTPATAIDYDPTVPEYEFDGSSYQARVYQGFGHGDYDALLKLGPNIKDWPEIAPLGDNLLLKVASYITDPVTTTDEPTTALDVSIQDQILKLLCELKETLDMSIILVTHDLGVVSQMCDRVAVMYAGYIVETADTLTLFSKPRHPYTEGLIQSMPRDDGNKSKLISIPGAPPNLNQLPEGCPFHPRCQYASDRCKSELPGQSEVEPGHFVRCHHTEELIGHPGLIAAEEKGV